MTPRYDRVAIALHWLLAAAILFQIGLGWYLGTVPRGTPARTLVVNFHKSIGITLAVFILLRLYWRLTHRPPPLPDTVPPWERLAARASHVALYACMVTMPTAGYIASNFSKFGIKYFNVWMLSPWGVDDRRIYAFFHATHVVTSYVLVTLIAIHVAAALRHLVRRDGVFSRMWPVRRYSSR